MKPIRKTRSLHDARLYLRYPLEISAPFRLRSSTGRYLPVIFVDVSLHGLGIFVQDEDLRFDSSLHLEAGSDATIELRVCWMTKDASHSSLGGYVRAGLRCKGESDLLAVFRDYLPMEG